MKKMDVKLTHTDKKIAAALERFLSENRRKDATLIDIGSGDGIHSDIALRKGYEVYAVDIIKHPRLDKRITFVKTDLDVQGIPWKNRFDIAICTEVIEHIENPHGLFRHINSCLKMGGKAFLSTPNLNNIFRRLQFIVKGSFSSFPSSPEPGGHINPIIPTELRLLAGRYGFKITRVFHEGAWLPLARSYIDHRIWPDTNLMLGESAIIILEKTSNLE